MTRGGGWPLQVGAALALLVVALGARLSLLVRANWLLEGDDALSALMAVGILRDGAHPIMLKNQTYAAAWEPYAMAACFALFGVSRVAAHLPELAASLGVVGAVGLLACAVAGRRAAWCAAAAMAVPPVYVLVLSLKPWAPYTEVLLLGTLALWAAVRLAWPRAGQPDVPLAGHQEGPLAVACGVAGGLAFWMHPLAAWYLATVAVLLVARVRGRRLLALAGRALGGFVVGAAPVWAYNALSGLATLRFVAAGTGGQTADRLAVLGAWWNADLPRGAGLWHPWGPCPALVGWAMGAVLASAVAWALVGRRCWCPRPLDGVLLLLVVIPSLFVLSGFGGPALNPYGFDATGRYAPPIWNALCVVLGAFIAAAWSTRRLLATAVAVVVLGANLLGILAVDPRAAFQSPYWDRLPIDNGPLLSALRGEGVDAVWMNHWAGQPAMFDAAAAGQRLVAYDWYDVQAGGIDRFPEYRPLVEASPRPAFVLVTHEARPALEERLDDLGVAFVERRAAPYVVVVPTSRRVHPSEVTAALDYRY